MNMICQEIKYQYNQSLKEVRTVALRTTFDTIFKFLLLIEWT